MKIVGIVKHIGVIIAGVILILGIPLLCTGYIHSLFLDDPDAVSSASLIIDQPSGNYIILINKAMHPDEKKLQDWVTYFSGGDILYIFEDISASVADGDAGGQQLADSFRSRLPENQMKVHSEDATLLVSRADQGLYDILIMSKEYAELFFLRTAIGDACIVISLYDVTSTDNCIGGVFATAQ